VQVIKNFYWGKFAHKAEVHQKLISVPVVRIFQVFDLITTVLKKVNKKWGEMCAADPVALPLYPPLTFIALIMSKKM